MKNDSERLKDIHSNIQKKDIFNALKPFQPFLPIRPDKETSILEKKSYQIDKKMYNLKNQIYLRQLEAALISFKTGLLSWEDIAKIQKDLSE